jgi:hypothetical protein
VYVEPYAKSQAEELHADSIAFGRDQTCQRDKVQFVPFVGMGPRRYFDLFSLERSSGYPISRKQKGAALAGAKTSWDRAAAALRVPMRPTPFLELEKARANKLMELVEGSNGKDSDR